MNDLELNRAHTQKILLPRLPHNNLGKVQGDFYVCGTDDVKGVYVMGLFAAYRRVAGLALVVKERIFPERAPGALSPHLSLSPVCARNPEDTNKYHMMVEYKSTIQGPS